MTAKNILILAAIFGGTSVIFGAFGAHALKQILSEHSLNTFETGVRYQAIHAVVLLFVALITLYSSEAAFKWAAVFFTAGIIFFSGSLYALAFGAPRWFGPITPLGGLGFISGWVLILVGAFRL